MRLICGLFVIISLFSSCKEKETEVFSFTNEVQFNINAGLDNVLTHIFVIEDLPSTFEAAAVQNGFSLEEISRVNTSTAEFRGIFEDGEYSNIQRVAVNIIDPAGEYPTQEIFFQEIIDINHTGPLQLFGSLSNVKDILTRDRYNIEIELQFRAPTTRFLENRFIYNFVAFDNE